jgi:hypothetical protein
MFRFASAHQASGEAGMTSGPKTEVDKISNDEISDADLDKVAGGIEGAAVVGSGLQSAVDHILQQGGDHLSAGLLGSVASSLGAAAGAAGGATKPGGGPKPA